MSTMLEQIDLEKMCRETQVAAETIRRVLGDHDHSELIKQLNAAKTSQEAQVVYYAAREGGPLRYVAAQKLNDLLEDEIKAAETRSNILELLVRTLEGSSAERMAITKLAQFFRKAPGA